MIRAYLNKKIILFGKEHFEEYFYECQKKKIHNLLKDNAFLHLKFSFK